MTAREIMDRFIDWIESLPGDEARKMIAYDYAIGFLHDMEEEEIKEAIERTQSTVPEISKFHYVDPPSVGQSLPTKVNRNGKN